MKMGNRRCLCGNASNFHMRRCTVNNQEHVGSRDYTITCCVHMRGIDSVASKDTAMLHDPNIFESLLRARPLVAHMTAYYGYNFSQAWLVNDSLSAMSA